MAQPNSTCLCRMKVKEEAENCNPAFLHNPPSISPYTNHTIYFIVGDPTQGRVERIGAEAAKLMASGSIMERILRVEYSDLNNQLDIPITNVEPKVFKNMLRFLYGVNTIKKYSLVEAIEMFKLADSYVLRELKVETIKHIHNLLSPTTVCQVLQEPSCLHEKNVSIAIKKIMMQQPEAVLQSSELHLVAPASMYFLLHLDSMQESLMVVWRAVIKWARFRLLKEAMSHNNRLDYYIQPDLVVPHHGHVKDCAINMIQLVEEAEYKNSARGDIAKIVSKYHSMRNSKLYMCTSLDKNNQLTHVPLKLKAIDKCYSWVEVLYKTSSDIIISTYDSGILLYSVGCTGMQKRVISDPTYAMAYLHLNDEPDDDAPYFCCEGTLTVSLLSETKQDTGANLFVVNFSETVMFGEEFQILLHKHNIKLKPDNNFRITVEFKFVQPLWRRYDLEQKPDTGIDFDFECGLVNKKFKWRGSHIRYLLYKSLVWPKRDKT